jgi:hypothetical protein
VVRDFDEMGVKCYALHVGAGARAGSSTRRVSGSVLTNLPFTKPSRTRHGAWRGVRDFSKTVRGADKLRFVRGWSIIEELTSLFEFLNCATPWPVHHRT